MTLWLSTDTDIDGVLMPYVDVWTGIPKPIRAGACIAHVSCDGQLTDHLVSLPRDVAIKEFGTAPDDHRQIIRVRRAYTEPVDVDRYLAKVSSL